MRNEDVFHWVFGSKDIDSLFKNLEVASNHLSNLPLKMCVFLSNSNIIDMFPSSNIKRISENVEILNKKENIIKFDFKILGNFGEEYKSKGIYFKHPEFENIFIYLSFDPMFIFKRVIKNYFSKFYPEVSRIFFTSYQIRNILENMSKNTKSEILVSRFVVNRRYPDSSTDVKYEHQKISYIQAFLEAQKENYWVSSLNLFADNLDAYISREGYFKLNGGSFRFFNENILKQALTFAENKKKFYSNRERTKDSDYQPKPLIIQFNHSLFNSTQDINNLIKKVFDSIPDSSYSISHFNPYLQMSFTDFGDGSSFDVWVINKDKINIVPQFRSTHSSLTKIINSIFENFSEGKVIDFNTGQSEFNA